MKVKCEYCDCYIDSSDEVCPHCGGPNRNMIRHSTGVPKTIEELKKWAVEHKLPLEQMHYYLGEDYKGPKAYGIYKADDGDFVVYKNKSDGTRAVRYKGTDEAYAVNELYEKMKLQVTDQKAINPNGNLGTPVTPASGRNDSSSSIRKLKIVIIIIVLLVLLAAFVIGMLMESSEPEPSYNSGYYVSQPYVGGSGGYVENYVDNSYSGSSDSSSYDSYSGSSDSSSYDPYWNSSDDSDDWDAGISYSGSSWSDSGTNWDSDWVILFMRWLR